MGCCILSRVEEHELGFEVLKGSGKLNALKNDEMSGSGSITVFDSKDLEKTLVWGF